MRRIIVVILGSVMLTGCWWNNPEEEVHEAAPLVSGSSSSDIPLPSFTDEERAEALELMEAATSAAASSSSSVRVVEITDADIVDTLMKRDKPSVGAQASSINSEDELRLMVQDYQRTAPLDDTSGGPSFGVARISWKGNTFSLFGSFIALPPLKPGEHYEGWLVRSTPFHYISTGKVDTIEGTMVNVFVADKDYRDHDRYVVTREPDDKDPVPNSKSILHGVFRTAQ